MKEQLISFQTAKLALSKGFDIQTENTFLLFSGGKSKGECVKNIPGGKYSNFISAPTQSVLQKWLREKRGIIVIVIYGPLSKRFCIEIYSSDYVDFTDGDFDYDTYEEALEEGLEEALKYI